MKRRSRKMSLFVVSALIMSLLLPFAPSQAVAVSPPPTVPLRVDVNSSSNYTDSSGIIWLADQAYTAGSWGHYTTYNPIQITAPIANTNDQVLYQTARNFNIWGGYKFDLPNGTYTVKLKMVDEWATAAGQRKFDIKMEDAVVASAFDIYAECGKLKACDRTYTTTVSDGQLQIAFNMASGSLNYATVSAIEITSGGGGGNTDTQSPAAPANLTVFGTPTASSISLSWGASTDNVGVTGYNVYNGSSLAATVTGTTATINGLTASTSYTFTVKAKDAAGNISVASNSATASTSSQPPQSFGNKIIGYWQSWAIYDSKGYYFLNNIDASKMTHLNYAFADICWNNYHGNGSEDVSFKTYTTCKDKNGYNLNVPNGTLVLGDPYADTQYPYATNDPSLPFQGAFNQLVQLKKQTGLKSIISVGGWTWSNRFSDMAADPVTRNTFVTSSVKFLRDYQLDGIDIDWEYPVELGLASNSRRPEDRQNYVLLLQELRRQLDAAELADGKEYTVTIAGGASPSYIRSNDLSAIASTVDWINLMTYDFHGDWDAKSGHNAPLYFDPADNGVDPQNFYIDAAVNGYLNNGVPANKLVIGIPFYGRGWNCGSNSPNNAMYQTCAKAETGTWSDQDAWWDYWDLEKNYLTRDANGNYTGKNGFTRYWNDTTKTPWLYNPTTGLTITYDDPISIKYKTDYLKSKGLAGAMFWNLDSDRDKRLITLLSTELPK
ncbi:chitinase [Paenibacillaceae bacterium GAS479]|nr:chitinase [Paenibacillaceae bacterium GAS479]